MHVAICFARTRQAPSGNRGRPGFAAALELLSAAAGYRCAAPPVDVPLRHAAEAAEGHVALKHAAQVRLEAVALSHHEVACKRTRRGPRQLLTRVQTGDTLQPCIPEAATLYAPRGHGPRQHIVVYAHTFA